MNPGSSPPSQRPAALHCRDKVLRLDGGPLMVGILNVTPDSFSDGGKYLAQEAAVARAHEMVAEGAAMIDIGGQSTRPGHVEVSVEEEMARVLPVAERLVRELPVPISIDTSKPAVAQAALALGVHVLNDIYGLQRAPEMASLAAAAGCAVIIMHQEPGFDAGGGDVIARMKFFFERSLELGRKAGIRPEAIVLDPGIGFVKTRQQNLEILARLGELRTLGHPLLLGVSRKSVIGLTLDLPVESRLEGTLATTALAAWQGVELLRVHDILPNVRAARMAYAIRQTQLP